MALELILFTCSADDLPDVGKHLGKKKIEEKQQQIDTRLAREGITCLAREGIIFRWFQGSHGGTNGTKPTVT